MIKIKQRLQSVGESSSSRLSAGLTMLINGMLRAKQTPNTQRRAKSITFYHSYLLLILSFILGSELLAVDYNKERTRLGYVMARSVVLSEDGNPIYVEYNTSGEIVREIGEAAGNYADAEILSASIYRQYLSLYQQQKASIEKNPAATAEVISTLEYASRDFKTQSNQIVSNKPTLLSSTQFVYVKGVNELTSPDESPIIVQAPFDLALAPDLSDATQSVLISTYGLILDEAEGNIGFKVGFFKGEDSRSRPDEQQGDEIYRPVPSVNVEILGAATSTAGITDDEGKFTLKFTIPPCPGFQYTFGVDSLAWLRYRSFSPRGQSHHIMGLRAQGWELCSGYSEYFLNDPTLISGGPLQEFFAAQDEKASEVITTNHFYVDTAVISGEGGLVDLAGDTIPITEETSYHYDEAQMPFVVTPGDFDNDGIIDQQIVGYISVDGEQSRFVQDETNGPNIGIYLSSNDDATPIAQRMPDFINAAYRQADTRDQGTLKSLSLADAEATDLYVFRESNGQLITYRQGLEDDWQGTRTQAGVDEQRFYYQMMIRGPKSAGFDSVTVSFDQFQSAANMDPALHEREADHLRPGEKIKIIAINRKTGYIGSVITEFGNSDDPSTISFPVDALQLQAPNLKVSVVRNLTVEAGLDAGEEREYLIGYEGAALDSDTTISVITEWYDHDGTPLPDGLIGEGLTGRVAKIIKDKVLGPEDGQIAQFAIEPGRHIQHIRLQNTALPNAYLYVQVNAEPIARNPDFSTLKGGDDIFAYRPMHFVPFKVPIYDRSASLTAEAIYQEALANGQSVAAPESVYQWHYRPEMQYSLLTYDIQSFQFTAQIDGTTDFQLSYDAARSDLEAVDLLSIEPDVVWSLGFIGDVSNVTVGSVENTVENVIDLYQNASPLDFSSLSVAVAYDEGNPLYDYRGLPVIITNDSTIGVSRSVDLSNFDDGLTTPHDTNKSDSAQKIRFSLKQTAKLRLELLDTDLNVLRVYEHGIILEPADDYLFALSHEQVAPYIYPKKDEEVNYYVRLTAETLDSPKVSDGAIWKGTVSTTVINRPLGQLIEHDVMLQDGNLTFNRQDLTLPGRGPDLTFIRSYNSINEDRMHRFPVTCYNSSDPAADYVPPVLSPGWTHNHHIEFRVTAYSNASGEAPPPNNLPAWFPDTQQVGGDPAIVRESDLPPDSIIRPARISVTGGGSFKWVGDAWYPARGNHGRLDWPDDAETIIFTSKDGTQYFFPAPVKRNAPTLVSKIVDRHGHQLTYTYENARCGQRVSTIEDAVGRSLSFVYEDIGGAFDFLTEVNASVGIRLKFSYEKQGGTRFPAHQLTRFERDDFQENYTYSVKSFYRGFQINSISDANAQLTRYEFYPIVINASTTDERLNTSDPALNSKVHKVIYPDNSEVEFFYEPDQVRRLTNLRGFSKSYILNTYGNPLEMNEPLNKKTVYTWSVDEGKPDNVMTSITDPKGHITTFEHDSRGNVIKETDPYNKTTLRSFDPLFNVLLSETDKNGNTRSATIDGAGNILTETDAEGNQVTHRYNALGERISTENARGFSTTFSYDDFGFLASVSQPSTVLKVNADDDDSPDTIITEYSNDERGRRTQMIDPNGNSYNYSYDNLDRLIEQQEPDGVLSYTYDNKGNKLSEVDKRGMTLGYEYDSRDRVVVAARYATRQDYDNNSPYAEKSFTYDAHSNVTSESDWLGQITSTAYDDLDRPTSITNRDGKSNAITYDLNGNKISESDFNGNVTTYAYDDINRLIKVTNALGDSTTNTYDNLNNKLSAEDFAGNLTQWEYDKRYLKISQVNSLGDRYTWTYDESGNLTETRDELADNPPEGMAGAGVTRFTYDALDRVLTETDALDQSRSFFYDANGNQTLRIDQRGQAWLKRYDSLNRPTHDIDPLGHAEVTTYDANGNVISQTDRRNFTTTMTYDAFNRLSKTTLPTGAEINYTTYSKNDQLLSRVDAKGFSYSYEYDALDRKRFERHPLGRVLEWRYDNNGNVRFTVDGNGVVRENSYDALNRVTEQKLQMVETGGSDGELITRFGYDKMGNKTSETDPNGNTTLSEYDALYRVVKVTDALAQEQGFGYDAVGNVISETDKRGTETTHRYDSLYRLLSSEKDTITLVRNTYTGEDLIDTVTDANDNTTRTRYDARRLPDLVTFADNSTQQQVYDENGNLTEHVDELGHKTLTTYDQLNRVVTITNAENETTRFAYDDNNNKTQTTKPKGADYTQVATYDDLNRLQTLSDAEGNLATYSYDLNDNVISYSDAKGQVTTYAYDSNNRKISHTLPGGSTSTMRYDNVGNLVSLTDAKGQNFSYQYDALHRRTLQSFPDGGRLTQITTSFDANNNIDTVVETKTSGNETTSHSYDNLDRLIAVNQRGQNLNYQYDANGNRTVVATSNETTQYRFDARNRLNSASTSQGQIDYTYYADGTTNTISYPNGTSVVYTYDKAKRTTRIQNNGTGGLLSRFDYTYDANGNRDSLTEVQSGLSEANQSISYNYDKTDRLLDYTETVGATTRQTAYLYDGNYNRASEIVTENGTITKNRTYNYNANNWLTAIDDSAQDETIAYGYDANGNTTDKTVTQGGVATITQMRYDSRDQLVQVIRGPPEAEVSQGEFDYNYAGMRIRHLGSSRGNIEYFYDGNAILEERNSDTNALVAHYRYADRLLSLSTTEGNQYYHYSGLSTTVNLSDDSGNLKASYRVDPWGNIQDQSGDSVNRQIFTGQEHDENTGLIYFGARFYDSDIARFINQDPYLGEWNTPPSLHRYLYAYANPTVYVDLMGYAAASDLSRATSSAYESGDYAGAAALGIFYGAYEFTNFISFGSLEARGKAEHEGRKGLDLYRRTAQIQAKEGLEYARERAQEGVIVAGGKVACDIVRTCKAVARAGKKAYDAVQDKVDKAADKVKAKLTKEKRRGPQTGTNQSKNKTESANSNCVCGPSCFVAGTLVQTIDGLRPIEKLTVGDWVASRDEKTGEIAWKPITNTFIYDDDRKTYLLTVKDENNIESVFEVTDNHPFWIVDQGWVDSVNLEPGMKLVDINDSIVWVESLVALDRSPITYNFEVADFHTYFVGKQSIWVHNQNDCCGPVADGPYSPLDVSKKAQLLRTGKNKSKVDVQTKGEADALVREAFPHYKQLKGQRPKNSKKKFNSKEEFTKAKKEWKKGGAWHKDYPIDSETGRVVGHEKGIHGEYPHINIRKVDKSQVHIDIVGPKKQYGKTREQSKQFEEEKNFGNKR